jgi:hypothetical protein
MRKIAGCYWVPDQQTIHESEILQNSRPAAFRMVSPRLKERVSKPAPHEKKMLRRHGHHGSCDATSRCHDAHVVEEIACMETNAAYFVSAPGNHWLVKSTCRG